ncbi:unnamed protein product [Didymodactylos carnosus]|uniref:RRM domain-containing protein n=1 Tax=Didymodactylos carnosus TaxID=1234261 RepID=A0A814FK00_9BILA|nr:unnamed protein product [Didymodactylos carnosus]CAF1179484.1 unnamed protein product [Didymodactylos carnosus]CAF3754177.1 unnamed protein product [Didymodactylos carnosus]CAF3990827.1 unnamed protein product [Didymodactylos carnosus]
MSRVIVKNLPKQVKEAQVRKHFEAFGTITDLQLKYTKDGIFRRFAFVGYINPDQAKTATEKLNKSFIGTSRIIVEECCALTDEHRPKPWSKYSEKNKVTEKTSTITIENNNKKNTSTTNSEGKKQLVDAILGDLKHDEKFKEFIKNVDSMKKNEKIIWNDTMKEDENNHLEKKDKKKKKEKDAEQQQPLVKEDEKVIVSSSKTLNATGPRYLIKIRGIPYTCKERDIRDFFSPLTILRCQLIRNRRNNSLTGICWLEFSSESDQKQAMLKNKSVMEIAKSGEHRYLELNAFIKNKEQQQNKELSTTKKYKSFEEKSMENVEPISETGEIFVRNLSYLCTEADLEQLFSKYGQITKIHMPLDTLTKKPKGFANITYLFPEHALKAYTNEDGQVFQGRLLHILPCKQQKQEQQNESSLSFKTQRDQEQKSSSTLDYNWNTLFLNPNVIADIVAQRYQTEKSNVLNIGDSKNSNRDDSLAVRLAIGETQIVQDTRQFLLDNNVRLDAFSQVQGKRSSQVILVKNLPLNTSEYDLKILFEKYGQVNKIILPPYGYCALVCFEHQQEARQAFKQLAYTKFKDNRPLYLEWAPMNAIGVTKPAKEEPIVHSEDHNANTTTIEQKEDVTLKEEEEDDDETFNLYVKNLNFNTTEQELVQHFSSIGPCKVFIAKKKDLKQPGTFLSMGYGFVEFKSKTFVDEALKRLQNSELNGHNLELKRSERTLKLASNVKTKRKRQLEKKQRTTKILIRNIPFQANVREIRELFTVFGELKFVRLPKKVNGTHHRGFGFADFVSKNDAKNAFDALCHSTHLYGRRLVLEWADEESETIEGLRRKTAAEFDGNGTTGKRFKRSKILSGLRELAAKGVGSAEGEQSSENVNPMDDGEEDEN